MPHILLAEDDNMISRMLDLRLSIAGYQVDLASNGQIAVKMAVNTHYDLILMDMHMPVLDGHQATRQLRETGYKGIIIAVTASALSQDCEKAIKSGCDHHIPKPIGPDFEQQLADILNKETGTTESP